MRIVQLSDLHAKDGTQTLRHLKHALEFIEQLKPAMILLSGDIASKPHETNYALARDVLARACAPVRMIPGNSDRHALLRAAFPDTDYWPRQGAFNFTEIVGDSVRVVALDVTVEGEKHGFATPESLGWLADVLNAGVGLSSLIMMHQNPFPLGVADLDTNMLRNADAFWAVVEGASDAVAAVVCGHGHRTVFTHVGGVPAMMCPSLKKATPLWLEGSDEPEITDPPGLLVHEFSAFGLRSYGVALGQ